MVAAQVCVAEFGIDRQVLAAQARVDLSTVLLMAARIPLFRLRFETPATAADERYAILTDEVLDKIDCGERIRSRDVQTTLVPLLR